MNIWANPEKTLRKMLVEAEVLPADRIGVSVPGNLEEVLPHIRLTTVRGADDGLTDRVVVDLEWFDTSRSKASDGAEMLRGTLHRLAGTQTSDGHLIDTVTTANRPHWVDYKNPKIHRYAATYEVSTRPVYLNG